MKLTPGLSILDLACGTGPITIPAARAVGSSGRVFGVDISGDSLSIAKAKAEKENLNAQFIQHDIAALHELKEFEDSSFDIITCASAFVLLEDPAAVIKSWAKFLKIGGKLIFDVPTYNSMIGSSVINLVGHKLGIPVAYCWNNLDAIEKVKPLLTNAGLDDSETFVTDSYKGTELDAKNAGDIFEGIVGKKEWFEGVYAEFNEPGRKESAKDMFCREMEKLADAHGKVMEDRRFTIAVGKKV